MINYLKTWMICIKKRHSAEDSNWLKYWEFDWRNKGKYVSFLFDGSININREYPPNTIIVAEPIAFQGMRYVVLLRDLKKKPSEDFRNLIKRISEKDFQVQIKKQKWKIPEKNQEAVWP